EQGVAAIAAYALVSFVVIFRNKSLRHFRNLINLAVKLLIILAVAIISYTLLTKGHPMSAIQYAFIDVPADQSWYFGTGHKGYLSWNTLLPFLFNSGMRYIWITIILGGASMYIFLKTLGRKHLRRPFWYMLSYGIIAFLINITGYYRPGLQLIPLQRMMALILIVFVVSLIFNIKAWRRHSPSRLFNYTKTTLLITLTFVVIYIPITFTSYMIITFI
ncbi:MAG: hypothetical protein WCK26_04220, partial [Candidatus Saccharibacteria bacterium]